MQKEQQKKIRRKAYEAYKRYWAFSHAVSEESVNEAAEDWLQYRMENGGEEEKISFMKYVGVTGFRGELWVCFEEFLDCEYNDRDLMERLLDQEDFLIYLDDIGEGHVMYIEALNLVRECVEHKVLQHTIDDLIPVAYDSGRWIFHHDEELAQILMTDKAGRDSLNARLREVKEEENRDGNEEEKHE